MGHQRAQGRRHVYDFGYVREDVSWEEMFRSVVVFTGLSVGGGQVLPRVRSTSWEPVTRCSAATVVVFSSKDSGLRTLVHIPRSIVIYALTVNTGYLVQLAAADTEMDI